jgi:hypothetical protein
MSGTELNMNPPINRENLRDVLVAIVVATGLVWVVAAYGGCAANAAPTLPSMIFQCVPSTPLNAKVVDAL